MYKKWAKVFGIIFIVIGILGFIPGITMHSYLFGVFHVNAAHNILHLATGLIAYWTSRTSMKASQMFFQIFGIIYIVIALLGFGYGSRDILGFLASNRADTWLRLFVGLIFLYCGFLYKRK